MWPYGALFQGPQSLRLGQAPVKYLPSRRCLLHVEGAGRQQITPTRKPDSPTPAAACSQHAGTPRETTQSPRACMGQSKHTAPGRVGWKAVIKLQGPATSGRRIVVKASSWQRGFCKTISALGGLPLSKGFVGVCSPRTVHRGSIGPLWCIWGQGACQQLSCCLSCGIAGAAAGAVLQACAIMPYLAWGHHTSSGATRLLRPWR